MMGQLRNIAVLFKMRIGVAIALSALAGIAVAPGPAPAAWQIALLATAVFLSAAGAGAFNQFVERDIDVHMSRTSNRPFINGTYEAGAGWLAAIVGLTLGAVALAGLAANWLSALFVFLGAFVYAVVYTVWLKRRTWLNIVVGGASGSLAVMAGAAMTDAHFDTLPLIFAVVLFLWTPPHFWALSFARREEYQRVGVPMLTAVMEPKQAAWVIFAHAFLLVAASLLPGFFGLGPLYAALAMAGGMFFMYKCAQLVRRPDRETAMAAFFASLAQLGAVLLGAIIDVQLPY
jgi:protoheme IX farnesyltransferase